MTSSRRIQSVISEARRPGHRGVQTRRAARGRRSTELVSEAVVAGYIHDLSQHHRRDGARPARRSAGPR